MVYVLHPSQKYETKGLKSIAYRSPSMAPVGDRDEQTDRQHSNLISVISLSKERRRIRKLSQRFTVINNLH